MGLVSTVNAAGSKSRGAAGLPHRPNGTEGAEISAEVRPMPMAWTLSVDIGAGCDAGRGRCPNGRESIFKLPMRRWEMAE